MMRGETWAGHLPGSRLLGQESITTWVCFGSFWISFGDEPCYLTARWHLQGPQYFQASVSTPLKFGRHTCNPNTQEVMAAGSGDSGHPWLQPELHQTLSQNKTPMTSELEIDSCQLKER